MVHSPEVHPDLKTEYISIKGEPVRRLYTDTPGDVSDVRERYRHLEADIRFPTRFMIDSGITSGLSTPSWTIDYRKVEPVDVNFPPRVCIIDVECNSERGWPDPELDEIIAITCWDSFDDQYTTFLYVRPEASIEAIEKRRMEGGLKNGCFSDKHALCIFRNEKDMMKALGGYVLARYSDILTGWNFTFFDLPYIIERLKALGLRMDMISRLAGVNERNPVRGRIAFDLLEGYKKMHLTRDESYRLDAIATKELGEQKVHYTGTISDMWKNHPDKLIEYNYVDVELCVGIDSKVKIIEFYKGISSYVGCPMDRSLNSSVVVDIYVLRKAHGKYVLPSKGEKVRGESYEGAIVFNPVKGVHENVAVLDLTSLYPMIMITLNASPEMKDSKGDLVAPNGVRFRSQPDGLVRSIVAELFQKRKDLKTERDKYEYNSLEYKQLDMQQAVVKIIMNTYYGVSGHAGFRLYDREIGEAITTTGQKILEWNRKIVVNEGYVVVMGDTDGCSVKLPTTLTMDETIAEARRIQKIMNDSYPDFAKKTLNADVSYFSVKFEKLYERFFSGGKKKRYAGLLIWKEGKIVHDIDVVGFEVRRSDSPAITRNTQKELIGMILEGKSFSEIKTFLSGIVSKYRSGKFTLDEMGIPGGVGKPLELYETNDAQIRGCKYANKYLKAEFGKGSKPKRVYIKAVTRKYPRTDVVAFEYGDTVPSEFIIDIEVMLEKTLQGPLSRVIEPMGWNWVEFDPSYTTLGDWGVK